MNEQQTSMAEERLQEIAERAVGVLPPYMGFFSYESYGPDMANVCEVVPDLVAEIRQLRAKVQEQDAEIKAARRNGDRTYRQLLDALTHPEDYTKIRATLLAREARIGPPPWPNVRSITYPTIPALFRGGTFKAQEDYAKDRGPAGFTITANSSLPTDTILMVNHPMLARAELVCARCGGWHKYMQQVIAIKDGIAADPVWVGCNWKGQPPGRARQPD